MTLKQTWIMPTLTAFQTLDVMEAPLHQTGWKSKITTGNGENQYGSEIVDDLLEFTHSVFINFVYLFTPVLFHKDFCSVFQKTVNKERKLQRENGRIEEK